MLRFVATVLFAILFEVSALAQEYRPGFIHTLNGDSVAGFVIYQNAKASSERCFFKLSKDSNKTIYGPDEIKAYGYVDDKYYESHILPEGESGGKPIFAEVMIKGKMTLMRYGEVFFVQKTDTLYVLRLAKTTVHVGGSDYIKTDKRYIGTLNYLMLDCGLNANKLDYTERALTNQVRNYNRCSGGHAIEYKVNLPWTKVSVSVFGSADFSKMKFNDDVQEYNMKTSTSFAGGGSIEVRSPRLNDRAFLCIEVWYVSKLYQGTAGSNSSTYSSSVSLNTKFLKIPIGVGYSFRRSANTPYVKLGFVEYLWLNQPVAEITKKVYIGYIGGPVGTQQTHEQLLRDTGYGIWFGAGYTHLIKTRLAWFAEARIDGCSGFFDVNEKYSAKIATLNITIGLKY